MLAPIVDRLTEILAAIEQIAKNLGGEGAVIDEALIDRIFVVTNLISAGVEGLFFGINDGNV
jgi:hypothetical protein